MLPFTSSQYELRPTAVQLYAANGTPIKAFGEQIVKLNLGLRREFCWPFVVADVTSPIIGADFISHFDLLIDLRRSRLIDNTTKLESSCSIDANAAVFVIKTFDSTSPFASLLSEYTDITKLSPYGTTTKSTILHHIETNGPPARAEFEYLMKIGICRPSSSNWSSPLHMVKKPDGTWRPCGDYRALNARTIPDRHPLPYLTDFTSNLRGKVIFSKIDLQKAFHQVPINPSDVPKTAITTPFGLFEFHYMTFGLCNAAQTFQRLIHEVLRGLNFVFPYIDDLCVAPSSFAEHQQHLKIIFDRLRENNLAINLAKCEFGKEKLSFLGHVVNKEGITPLPEKVAAIKSFSKPKVAKEWKRFIAMINFYRKFLPHAVIQQSKLQSLIIGNKKNDRTPLQWTDETESAFENYKNELANATLLAHPSADAQLVLHVDASDIVLERLYIN